MCMHIAWHPCDIHTHFAWLFDEGKAIEKCQFSNGCSNTAYFYVFDFSSLVLLYLQKCKFMLYSLNQKLVYKLTSNSGHYNCVPVSLLVMECTEHQILLPPKGQYLLCCASNLFGWIMEEVSLPFSCSEVEAPLLILVLGTWQTHVCIITVVMLNQRMWERWYCSEG
jgi:hypothetical protein